MAKLVVKTEGMPARVIQLKLGTNRFGRSPENDFQIVHATISSFHCELVLSESGVLVRDKDSTNGTFINNEAVENSQLEAGQTLRIGDVELLVESTDANVIIPEFSNTELPAPPVMAQDGGMMCPRHSHARVTYQCTKCREVMCDSCVHRLRRRGGKLLKLCPNCSGPVELLGAAPKKKKNSFLGLLEKTVKLTFAKRDSDES